VPEIVISSTKYQWKDSC